MARSKNSNPQQDLAPDLEIFGDQVTLHPSGYVGPPEKDTGGEQALMSHAGRFRESPLE